MGHIPVILPQHSPADYYNQKGYYSVLMQGLVDYRGIFMDVYAGWPGKVHDAHVFTNSDIYKKGRQGMLLPDWKKTIGGVQVCKTTHYIINAYIYLYQAPLVILGDPVYPALPWLMKPYSVNLHTTDGQCNFNYRKSRVRMVVENAFGRLKGRWRCLQKCIDVQVDNAVTALRACVVLHNICEAIGDHYPEEWTQVDTEAEIICWIIIC